MLVGSNSLNYKNSHNYKIFRYSSVLNCGGGDGGGGGWGRISRGGGCVPEKYLKMVGS